MAPAAKPFMPPAPNAFQGLVLERACPCDQVLKPLVAEAHNVRNGQRRILVSLQRLFELLYLDMSSRFAMKHRELLHFSIAGPLRAYAPPWLPGL